MDFDSFASLIPLMIGHLGSRGRSQIAGSRSMNTLTYEEVYRSEYRDLADAYAQIGEFLERVYNQ